MIGVGDNRFENPSKRFPKKADLRAIIAVENRQGKRMRTLLTDLHLVQRRPVRLVSLLLDVDIAVIRQWFHWYGIEMRSYTAQGVIKNLLKSQLGLGIILSRIQKFYQQLRDWKLVAKAAGVSLEELTSWMNEHLMNLGMYFTSSDLASLLGSGSETAEKAEPEKPDHIVVQRPLRSGVVIHPCGLHFLQEVQDAINHYCAEHQCTEQELFSALYDPHQISESVKAIGISEGIYSSLVMYYNEGTFDKRVFKHPSGEVLPIEYQEKVADVCQQTGREEADLFDSDGVEQDIDARALQLGISTAQYTSLASYFRKTQVLELSGG